MNVFNSVFDTIGNTPLIQLSQIDTGVCQLFLKLENQNPGGSIKDRIGLSMINAAEKEGKIKPGSTIIEATAGNTGLGLALIAARKGYRLILVIPDKMSLAKIAHLRALGAEIHTTRSDVAKGHPEYYQDIAERLSKEIPNSFYINQFENPANALAHETTTGPEIWQQMGKKVDAIVCGVGSGGTLSGLGRFFKKTAPHVKMVVADPKGSIIADLVNKGRHEPPGSWLVEGVGEDFIPKILDMSLIHAAYTIDDAESMETARLLLRREGILAGSSSGTLIAAALRYCRQQRYPQRVVTFVCDSGNKYLSKTFDDRWMEEQGLLTRNRQGDLRDVVARPYTYGQAVTARPTDTIRTAYKRMRQHDVSQIPVLDNAQIIGMIDETIILQHACKRQIMDTMVSEIMTRDFPKVEINVSQEKVCHTLENHPYVAVQHQNKFIGLITRADMIQQSFVKPNV